MRIKKSIIILIIIIIMGVMSNSVKRVWKQQHVYVSNRRDGYLRLCEELLCETVI